MYRSNGPLISRVEMPEVVAYALSVPGTEGTPRLFGTPLGRQTVGQRGAMNLESPGIPMSRDAARMSTCATTWNCEKVALSARGRRQKPVVDVHHRARGDAGVQVVLHVQPPRRSQPPPQACILQQLHYAGR